MSEKVTVAAAARFGGRGRAVSTSVLLILVALGVATALCAVSGHLFGLAVCCVLLGLGAALVLVESS